MPKKLKFRPGMTRIKLNPEQAVLVCGCYLRGRLWRSVVLVPDVAGCVAPRDLGPACVVSSNAASS